MIRAECSRAFAREKQKWFKMKVSKGIIKFFRPYSWLKDAWVGRELTVAAYGSFHLQARPGHNRSRLRQKSGHATHLGLTVQEEAGPKAELSIFPMMWKLLNTETVRVNPHEPEHYESGPANDMALIRVGYWEITTWLRPRHEVFRCFGHMRREPDETELSCERCCLGQANHYK